MIEHAQNAWVHPQNSRMDPWSRPTPKLTPFSPNTPHTPTPNQQVSPGFFFFIFLYVDLYWLGPYMLMKYRRDQYVEDWELIACMILWG